MAKLLIQDDWPEYPYSVSSPWGMTNAEMKNYLRSNPFDKDLMSLPDITWSHVQVLYENDIFTLIELQNQSASDIAALHGISAETADKWFRV